MRATVASERGTGLTDPRPGSGLPSHYLYPGDLFVCAEPHAASTILGTCVSVCLFDPAAGVGGVNHYLLPLHVGPAQASPRFGDIALETLLSRVLSVGASRSGLSAKVFGGMRSKASFPKDLGTRNVEIALSFLAQEGIRVIARDVGGDRARKLVFETGSGQAWVKVI